MRLLIIDFLRRWKYGYLLAGLFALGFVTISHTALAKSQPIYPVALYLGPFLLSFDFAKGASRVIGRLPVSAAEVGRAWHCIGVLIPLAAAGILRLTAMALTRAWPQADTFSWSLLVISMLWEAAYIGAIYFLLTIQPAALSDAEAGRSAKATLWGGAWGLSFGSVALAANYLPSHWSEFTPFSTSVMMAGIALGAVTYLRAGKAVARRIRTRAAKTAATGAGPAAARQRQGLGGRLTGIWQLAHMSNIVVGAAGMFVVFTLIDCVILRNHQDEFLHKLGSAGAPVSVNAYWFIAALLVFGLGSRVSTSLRHWRSLPLSSGRLALVCLLPIVIGCITTWGVPNIASALYNRAAPPLLSYGWLSAYWGILCLAQAVVIWSERKEVTYVAFISLPATVVGASYALNSFRESPWLVPALAAFGGMAAGTSAAIIKHALRRRPGAYKRRELVIGMTPQAAR